MHALCVHAKKTIFKKFKLTRFFKRKELTCHDNEELQGHVSLNIMEMIIKIDQMFYLLRELPSTALFWKRGRGAVFYIKKSST